MEATQHVPHHNTRHAGLIGGVRLSHARKAVARARDRAVCVSYRLQYMYTVQLIIEP